jgi:hypothetical protein
MTRAGAIGVGLSLLLAALRVGAEEVPAPPPPPQPPPAWMPYYAPGPTLADIDALEAAGHHQKRIGAILMASGGGLALVGTGLMIAGAWSGDSHCYYNGSFGYYYGYYGGYYDACVNTALTVAGATTTLVGLGALIPGIVEYVNGGHDVDDARAMRQRCGSWCWHPTLNRGGAGLELQMSR